MKYSRLAVQVFFEAMLPTILKCSKERILEFMKKYDTDTEWTDLKELNDYKGIEDELDEDVLNSLKNRAYDVDYMTDILSENICDYCEDETILENIEKEMDKVRRAIITNTEHFEDNKLFEVGQEINVLSGDDVANLIQEDSARYQELGHCEWLNYDYVYVLENPGSWEYYMFKKEWLNMQNIKLPLKEVL